MAWEFKNKWTNSAVKTEQELPPIKKRGFWRWLSTPISPQDRFSEGVIFYVLEHQYHVAYYEQRIWYGLFVVSHCDFQKMSEQNGKGSSGLDTELTVHLNTEINALILRQLMLLDGCVFAREKSLILSARAPPCRILKPNLSISKFKRRSICRKKF